MRMRLFLLLVLSAVSTACVVSTGYDPCAGKQPGDECRICPPDDSSCVETMEVKVCSTDRVCGKYGR